MNVPKYYLLISHPFPSKKKESWYMFAEIGTPKFKITKDPTKSYETFCKKSLKKLRKFKEKLFNIF